MRDARYMIPLMIEFVTNHEARSPDVDDRLNGAAFDFDAVLDTDSWQAAGEEAAQLDLESLVGQLIVEGRATLNSIG